MTEAVEIPIDGNPTGFRRAMREMMQSAKDGTREVESSFGGLNRVFDGVRGHIAALGVAVSAGGFAALIKGSIDAADHLHDMSERTGMSVEVLAGLKLVADQSGTSLEGLGTAFKKLSVNLVDASAGNKEMTAIFKGLGISGTNAQEAMYRLADIMKTLPDGAQKIALAVKLLGRSGEEMIPVLNQGGAEMRKMIEHGQKLSGVTSEMSREADQFNDQLAELNVQSQATGIAMAKYALPALNDIAAAMREAAKEGGILRAVWVGLGGVGAALFTDEFASNVTKLTNAKKELLDLEHLRAGLSKNSTGIGLVDNWLWGDAKNLDAKIAATKAKIETLKKALEVTPKAPDVPQTPAVDVTKVLKDGKTTDPAKEVAAPDSYMSYYETILAYKKNEYEQENILRQFSKEQELAYWQRLLESATATEKDRQAITKRTATLDLEIRRDAAKQQLDLDAAAIERGSAAASAQLAIDQARAQAELDNGITTKEQFLAQEEQFEARRYQIALQALAERIALAEKDPTRSPAEIAKLYAEVDALDAQHQIARIQNTSQVAQESGQIWESLHARLTGLWDQGMQAMLNGTLTWSSALRAIGAQVVAWFATDVVGKQVKTWLFGETAKTGATTTGTAMRLVIEAGAALKSVGIWAAAAIKNIMINAWSAMAGAYAAIAAIPGVGPFLAPVVAAGVFVGVAKLASNIMSAEGGYDIPRGINPMVQLHEQEMVLPAKHANTIRDLADGGGTAGVGPTVNYYDNSGRLTREEIERNAGLILKALQKEIRNFAYL